MAYIYIPQDEEQGPEGAKYEEVEIYPCWLLLTIVIVLGKYVLNAQKKRKV